MAQPAKAQLAKSQPAKAQPAEARPAKALRAACPIEQNPLPGGTPCLLTLRAVLSEPTLAAVELAHTHIHIDSDCRR